MSKKASKVKKTSAKKTVKKVTFKQVEGVRYEPMTLAGYLDLLKSNTIVNNIANRPVNELRVKRIVERFDINSIGMPTCRAMSDGKLQLLDFHHRNEALRQMYLQNRLNSEQLGYPLVVKVLPETTSASTRMLINDQAAYSVREKMVNIDSDFGRIFKGILQVLEDEGCRVLKKQWNQLAYNIYTYATVPEERRAAVTYKIVLDSRRQSGPFAEQIAFSGMSSFTMTPEDVDRIIEATKYAIGIIDEIFESEDKDAIRIAKKTTLFGFLVYLCLFHPPIRQRAKRTRIVEAMFKPGLRNSVFNLVYNPDVSEATLRRQFGWF